MLYIRFQTKIELMTKKRSSEILGGKKNENFFLKKVIQKFPSPKVGAKSPPMLGDRGPALKLGGRGSEFENWRIVGSGLKTGGCGS